jgi:tetratricopeptide (TPR) repeat protein
MKRVWHLPELTTKAKIGFGVAIIVVVIVAVTYIVTSTISRQLSGAENALQQDFTKKDTTARQQDARKGSAEAIVSGDDKTSDAIYRKALDAEKDPTRKVLLAIDQSRLLSVAGQFDKAVSVAKEAESYSTDKYLIDDWLARLYYNKGKKYFDAAEYYAKAGELVSSPTNTGKYPKKYYDEKVALMKSLADKK